MQYVREVRAKDPGMGGVKLWHMYRSELAGLGALGRDRFEDMLDENYLKVRPRKRKPRTTDSTHGLPTYPNIIKDFIPTAPNQLWVSDITYIEISRIDCLSSFCFLSLVLDAYTKEIVGYSIGRSLDKKYPIAALRMAMRRLRGRNGEDLRLIHHSDRGVQYASSEYIKILNDNHIRISMTETGDPKDNAMAERINNTMKNELLNGLRFNNMDEVTEAVDRAVAFYNNERPHMSIDMMTPAEAALCTGELRKRWKSYREIAIYKIRHQEDIAEKSLPSLLRES